jgi:hypothetical protein
MPVSQGSAGGFIGLNLKAWARFAADGTLIGGLNVSSVVRVSAGVYEVNFSTAMGSANYVMRYLAGVAAVQPNLHSVCMSAATAIKATLLSNSTAPVATNSVLYVEFYE